MTSTLLEDTGVLLALDMPELHDDLLTNVSRTMVMWIALEAKTGAYNGRVTRALAAAANEGATIEQLSAAAGLSPETVLQRLAEKPELLTDLSVARLNVKLGRVDPVAAIEPAPAVEPPHSPATPDPADETTELVGTEVRLDGPRRVAKAELVNRGGLLGWLGFGRRA